MTILVICLKILTTLLIPQCLALSPNRYFVLRHGETDANAAGIIQGSADFSRLTVQGRQQAGEVSKVVDNLGRMDAVYVSPLARARDTLSRVRQQATDLPEETVWHDLRELDLHEWEGRNKIDLQTTDAVAWKAWEEGNSFEFDVSGKKPLVDVWDRADAVWKKLRLKSDSPGRKTLLVCHATLGQALLNTALGRDASFFRDIRFPNCGLVEIEWEVDSPKASWWRWHHPEPSDRLVLSEWEKKSRGQL